MGKRLNMTLCPACDGAVIKGDTHGPEDDLRAIRERDRAYNTGTGGLGMLVGNLANMPTGRLQMAADRRMLLRMLDAELAAPQPVPEDET